MIYKLIKELYDDINNIKSPTNQQKLIDLSNLLLEIDEDSDEYNIYTLLAILRIQNIAKNYILNNAIYYFCGIDYYNNFRHIKFTLNECFEFLLEDVILNDPIRNKIAKGICWDIYAYFHAEDRNMINIDMLFNIQTLYNDSLNKILKIDDSLIIDEVKFITIFHIKIVLFNAWDHRVFDRDDIIDAAFTEAFDYLNNI